MTVNELSKGIGATVLAGQAGDRPVQYGYTCDLLSHVMSHGVADMAWVTVQTHLNVVAVATLLEFSCVVIPENLPVDEAILAKAGEEEVTILSTQMSAFEVVAYLAQNGVEAARKT